MQLSEMKYSDAAPVEGYGPDFFRIAGELFKGGLLVLPGLRQVWAGYEEIDAILGAASQIDVLFVGTGAELSHIPAQMRSQLEEAGIGVEIMASPQACRTFNVLLSEGRRVALAVLPVGDPA